MIANQFPGLRSLSADEKILLAAELWREAVESEAGDPSPELVEALRERLDYFNEHPELTSDWETVRTRLTTGMA